MLHTAYYILFFFFFSGHWSFCSWSLIFAETVTFMCNYIIDMRLLSILCAGAFIHLIIYIMHLYASLDIYIFAAKIHVRTHLYVCEFELLAIRSFHKCSSSMLFPAVFSFFSGNAASSRGVLWHKT